MKLNLRYLPLDIQDKVKTDFDADDALMVISLLSCKYCDKEDVRWDDAVIRGALYLSDGNLEKLKSLLKYNGARTVLLNAEFSSGGYGHYFGSTFQEIETAVKKINQEALEHLNEEEKLPTEFYDDDC